MTTPGTVVLDDVDGVLLDIDDTLVDTRAAFGTGLAAIAEVYLPHLGEDERARALELWRADASGYYRRHTRGELTASEQRLLRARELHAAFGAPRSTTTTSPPGTPCGGWVSRAAGGCTTTSRTCWCVSRRRGSPSGP
ncbi:hypothetical protein [Serinibacter arcticus]|uniref:hypothetical protein n=1 Tax=Serinibacter arcticus TaxID=1655435 RepID=UPI001F21BA21|nr:hypothetical protein [Serinibacter arcticus]